MFEQSVLTRGRGARQPMSMALSAVVQVLLIGGMVLVPLIFTDAIPSIALATTLTAPRPPAARPCCAAPPEETVVRVAPRPFDRSNFTAPRKIPRDIVILTDVPRIPGASIALAGGTGTGPSPIPGWLPAGFFGSDIPAPVAAPPPTKPKPVVRKQPVRVPVGGDVRPPVLLRSAQPVYPLIARSARVAGTVTLRAVIGTDGRIKELRVVQGHPLLSQAAVNAVRQWVYRPTLLNNEPVEVVLEVGVLFRLQ